MKPGIKTISQLSGFSAATVSNALNNKKGVNRETSEKIFKIAREIGYLSEIKINRIKVVIYRDKGAIVNDSPFFSSLVEGVESESRNFGFDTVVVKLSKDDPDYDARLDELLNDTNSALMLLATELTEGEAAKFAKAVAPIVIIDNWFEYLALDAILIDNSDAAAKAVEYLVRMGHKRIGYLKGNYEIKNFYYRSQGYLRALKENRLEYYPQYTFRLPPNMEGACSEMMRLLKSTKDLPTAFFADNDMIALGAMRAIQQSGYRVPEDISIVGFDDLPFCAISTPPLTTIKVYKNQLGSAAVRRLVEKIKYGDDYKTKIQICSGFVKRGSVLCLNDAERQAGELLCTPEPQKH
jgi:LacI family transcriptional regulator